MAKPESCYTDGSHRFWYDDKPVAQVARLEDCPNTYVLAVTHKDGSCDMVGMFDHYPTVYENVAKWEAWIYG